MPFFLVLRPHLGDICPSENHVPMLRSVARPVTFCTFSSNFQVFFFTFTLICVTVLVLVWISVRYGMCVYVSNPPQKKKKPTLFKPNQTLVGLWASSISNTLISYSAPYLCLLPPPAPN